MDFKLEAKLRADKEKMAADYIPAVLYGKGRENLNLQIKINEFIKMFSLAGESNLIALNIEGQEPVKVLVKDTQFNLIKDTPRHVDFYQVNMKEKIKTEIPLHFVGEAKAVKDFGGSFIHEITSVEIECLPADLVDHLDVDISSLSTFDDEIRIFDIKLPEGLKMMHETNDIVAKVAPPRIEEAAPEVAAAPAPEEAKKDAKTEDKK